MHEQITLYTAKICPFAHRVELALEEAKAGFTSYEIDLKNKPEWYAPQVNPASKVRDPQPTLHPHLHCSIYHLYLGPGDSVRRSAGCPRAALSRLRQAR